MQCVHQEQASGLAPSNPAPLPQFHLAFLAAATAPAGGGRRAGAGTSETILNRTRKTTSAAPVWSQSATTRGSGRHRVASLTAQETVEPGDVRLVPRDRVSVALAQRPHVRRRDLHALHHLVAALSPRCAHAHRHARSSMSEAGSWGTLRCPARARAPAHLNKLRQLLHIPLALVRV